LDNASDNTHGTPDQEALDFLNFAGNAADLNQQGFHQPLIDRQFASVTPPADTHATQLSRVWHQRRLSFDGLEHQGGTTIVRSNSTPDLRKL